MRVRREGFDTYLPNESEMWGEEKESEEVLCHKKMIRKRLEEKLESRRLKHELEDYDEDYDMDDNDR